jgi:hypothetical protein
MISIVLLTLFSIEKDRLSYSSKRHHYPAEMSGTLVTGTAVVPLVGLEETLKSTACNFLVSRPAPCKLALASP